VTHRLPRRHRARAALATLAFVAALLALLVPLRSSNAATPGSGTVSASNL
jgi:hypothetical protein